MKKEPSSTKAGSRKAYFQVNAALLEELGERLVSKPEVALAELVKNAYDADAKECTLALTEDAICVADDGHGMTEEIFLNNWMVISSQNKGKARFSRQYGRSMAGSKGVGRFSARYLGAQVTLQTTAQYPDGSKKSLEATFDWDYITRATAIGDVAIPYRVTNVSDRARTGTMLRISGLREEATSISISTLKTDVLRLTDAAAGLEAPPFRTDGRKKSRHADPGFSLVFEGEGQAENSVDASLQKEILDAYVGRVRIHVDEDGVMNYEVFWKGYAEPLESKSLKLSELAAAYTRSALSVQEGQPADARGLVPQVQDILHLPVAEELHSPVFIDLRFFPKRKGTFSGLSVDGRTALGWVRDHASYAVVDNHFAMAAYAEDSDWLAIDASKALNQRNWQSIFTPMLYPMGADRNDTGKNPMLALPRGPQLIGRVHISTHKHPGGEEDSDSWLLPNMDRESLRSNGAFRLLWHVARFGAELLAHFDRKTRLEAEYAQYVKQQEQTRTSLAAAIAEIRHSQSIEPEYRKRVVEQLKAVETTLDQTRQYEQDARLSLELMSMMGVMAGFMTHEFEKAMDILSQAAARLKALAAKDRSLGAASEEVSAHEHALANYLDYMRIFIDRARHPVPQSFKSFAQASRAAKTLGPIIDAHGIKTEIEIDAKLPGPLMPIAAYNGIVINLVSNAVKALVPKVSDDDRKIRIYAVNDATNHILVCADNGIGIPDFLRQRIWDPLFSTTSQGNTADNPMASGLGLGLSVVKQVVSKMGGKIDLMESAPPGYNTAFKVTLPLQ
ncbi:sensor histidine kinase [Noviherbaspirillum sp. ST9]|uniref:sensor histidine kinase n=1 Tax=Noviherbaspirillum sp. ST9 TaxID=3401606 RepID=UPI003B587FD2